ncbi:MAG TPA: hypothetical protein VFF81_05335 [Noviherbaspirillum sp.]|nr:hypothetical protein [Noviherbaspirillum sp.]
MRNEPLIFFHLKLVGKISLGVGTVAVLSLLFSLALVSGENGDSYTEIIRNNSITRAHLASVMLMIGLMLVAIAGVITWLIALYSSFRVAGPLYRFSKNLKLASSSNYAPLVNLREGDSLTEQAEHIKNAVSTLRNHYAQVERAAADGSSALANGDAEAYAEAIARLKALDEKVCV